MYPDRIGRVIIDGAGDPRRWAGENWKLSEGWFGNAEDAFIGFLEGCIQVSTLFSIRYDY